MTWDEMVLEGAYLEPHETIVNNYFLGEEACAYGGGGCRIKGVFDVSVLQ